MRLPPWCPLLLCALLFFFFFSSRRRHTRFDCDWSSDVCSSDLIAASGTTPFVRAALTRAQTIGAVTGLVSCSDPPKILAETCDVLILPKVGPEVLTGSTRMKAGTATKLVLNTLSTGAMIRLGRAYGNLMVDLMAVSDKLRDRGERIVMEVGGVDRPPARPPDAGAAGGGGARHCDGEAGRGQGRGRAAARAGGRIRAPRGRRPPARDRCHPIG